jgi:hypothetical protein
MPEKQDNTARMNEELRRQRNQARQKMGKLPESGGFDWKSLSQEKRVDVDRRRKTYRKVIARVDKLLGSDQKTPAKAPAAKPKPKEGTPGEKLIGKHVQKAAGLKPLIKTLQTAAEQGLKKKQNSNQN